MLLSNFKEAQRGDKAIHMLNINDDVSPQIVDVLLRFAYCFKLRSDLAADEVLCLRFLFSFLFS
jgi:hypothetical protein